MEYEIGKAYIASDGKPYIFKGGDPSDRGNWEEAGARPSPQASSRPSVTDLLRQAVSPRAHADAAKAVLQAIPGADEMRAGIRALSPNVTFKEALAEEQADLQRIQAENPTASGVAEGVGNVALMAAPPVAVGARMIGAGRGLLSTAAASGATGAAGGGLLGFLNAEGGVGERAAAAMPTAAIGGLAGLTGGVGAGIANMVARRTSGRGTRVAEALQDLTGTRADLEGASDFVKKAIGDARTRFYKPLEEALPEVNDPALLAFLRSPTLKSEVAHISRDVASGKRAPSFEEIQRIRARLRRVGKIDGKFNEQLDQMAEHLQRVVPGLREADRAYAQAVSLGKSLDQGRKFWNKGAADIRMALEKMPEGDREMFQQGRLYETVRRLEQRDEAAGAALKKFMDAGPESEAVMRSFFRDDASFEAFQRVLEREKNAEKIAAALRRFAPWVAAGAAGAGAAAAMRAGTGGPMVVQP